MNIEWYIWEPDKWQKMNGFEVSLDRCRYQIQDNYRFYQCSRKAKVEIEGYGFCTQHAKKIQRRLDAESERA